MHFNLWPKAREFEMKKFEYRVTPRVARLEAILNVQDCEDSCCLLTLKLRDGYLSCLIETASRQVSIGCHFDEGHWMTLHHDKRERCISEAVNFNEIGTRGAFSDALRETPFSSDAVLAKQLLDVICDFAKGLNLFIEPEPSLW
jgi:hypothetical protein